MPKSTVVLGLGNPLMADEGIGVYLVDRLAESAVGCPDVDFIDVGTGGLALLHHIEGRRRAIFLDCAYMGLAPGTIRRFRPDDVRSAKVLAHQSLHEADLLQILDMAGRLGQAPDEVVIFGIEPERVEPGLGLSASLMGGVDGYLALVLQELNV